MAAVEEEEPSNGEMVMSDHEKEEDDEGTAKKHRQLVDVLSALAGGKRRRVTERTEASGQISEFNVGAGGADEKVVLSELLQPISASPALNVVRKQLNKVQQKKALQLPLSKEENERVIREAAYAQTSHALAKWDPVVQQNRRAEQLTFPLQQEGVTVTPVEEVISSWQARTPLEKEIFNLLHKAKQPIKDPLLTPQEKTSLQAMSLEEARLRRMELQRARALQSYYEAKARRERKIKSKKYHKVLRKSKSLKALQEFEMLQKCNPQAALEQLEKMEKSRIEERMSLKHQNKGRWAKSTAIMAKYDLETRKAMQEQLAKNKELTQKVHPASDSEQGGSDSEAEREFDPHVVNEGPAGMEPENPWMLGKPRVETEEDPPSLPGSSGENKREEEVPETIAGGDKAVPILLVEALQPPQSPVPEGPILSEKLEQLRTLEDMEALELEEIPQEEEAVRQPKDTEFQQPTESELMLQPKSDKSQASKKTAKRKTLIDLQSVLTGTPQITRCPIVPTAVQAEGEMGTDQRLFIQEAFASDNVVSDFMKEKRKAEQAGKAETINLVLPGWGEWGGKGLKPSNRKRRRFLIKPKPGPPRKDRHLPHVILSEKRNILAAAHQVNQLPFPFENSQQFERSIQTPVGPTWYTQRVFQQLTAPHIITQPGHIIQPISAEDADLISKTDRTKVTGQKPDLALKLSPKKHHPHSAPKKKAKKK